MITALMFAIGLPGALSMVVLAALAAVRRASDSRLSIAISTGFIGGCLVVFGLPPIVPADAQRWMFHIGVIVFAMACCPVPLSRSRRMILTGCAGSVAGALLVHWKLAAGGWTAAMVVGAAGASGAVALVQALFFASTVTRLPPRGVLGLWAAILIGGGYATAWSGFASVGLLCWGGSAAVLVAAAFGATEAAVCRAAETLGVLWISLVLCAFALSPLTSTNAGLLLAAPGVVWLLSHVPGAAALRMASCAAGVLLTCGMAVWCSIPAERYW